MIFDIFSKRNNIEENEIFEYVEVPNKLRVQLVQLTEVVANNMRTITNEVFYRTITKILCVEYGRFNLIDESSETNYMPKNEYKYFLMKTQNVEYILDTLEVAIFVIKKPQNNFFQINKLINEMNLRFIENNMGYEYVEDKFIRIDRKFTHNEIVKPALNLMFEKEFENANKEFLTGFEHYRTGCSKENPSEDFKNAIINCNKAFESTMKIICKMKGVPNYKDNHTAKELLNDLLNANILPRHLENSFHGLKNIIKGIKSSLESGLPVIRNKVGHGLGTEEEWISEEYVIYAINLLATNIILLVNIYKKL